MEEALIARRQRYPVWGVVVFVLIVVAGLFYVKWSPYYHRAFVAADKHSIGQSILSGSAASAPAPSLQAAIDYAIVYGKSVWQALVLGLLLGSGVQALIPPRWITKALGKAGFGSVAAGGLLSIPGMMCTCCAAPVVVGLRKRQASPGSAVAFWLGNSVLNPATLVFMGFVLGWQWSGLRLVLGLAMVFGLGYVVNRMVTPGEAHAAEARIERLLAEPPQGGVLSRWMSTLARMTLWLVPEYLILVLLLGAARAWLFPQVGPEISNDLMWIVAFAVAGTLFVIPTAGEVPIIQTMLALGMAAGPAGALLMTLAPVSVPSLAMTGRALGLRALTAVVLGVILFGVAGGLLTAVLKF